MDLLFEREVIGETTRLVLEIGDREGLDQFAINMMNHNNIAYLAPMELTQYNERNYLRYDITDKDTLKNWLSKTLNKNEVVQILNSIISAFEETDAYMLSEDGMFLRTEHIYVTEQGHCIFLYLPFEQGDFMGRISFLKVVVEQITPNYEEKDAYLFNILNAFNRGAIRKVSDLKEILRKNSADLLSVDKKPRTPEKEQISEGLQTFEKPSVLGKLQIPGKAQASEKSQASEVSQMPVKQEVEKPQSSANISFAIPGKNGDLSINIPGVKKDGGEKKEGKKKEKKKEDKKKENKISLFGGKSKEVKEIPQTPQSVVNRQEYAQNKNDDMYESYEQTVLMEEQPADNPDLEETVYLNISENIAQLERKSTGEYLEIARNNAIIGSGIGADCQITGNKAISRTHATISIQNGAFFITDNHSSNGTWVDGSRLIPDRAEELHTEALIKLANEEFIFRTR